ncbi:MAG: hypothetical protein PHQ43_00540 [Dehalococcoidales bacterium]|nr:hypothetical protein [Dehalococcoidales bacterium]
MKSVLRSFRKAKERRYDTRTATRCEGDPLPVAVDATKGTLGVEHVVRGVLSAADDGIPVILIGNIAVLRPLLGQRLDDGRIKVLEPSARIASFPYDKRAICEDCLSTVAGIRTLENAEAAAFVSAGNPDVVMARALQTLGLERGVTRPALATYLPGSSGPVLLLDAGANVDCSPQTLSLFARLGHHHASKYMGLTHPRICLLSNGEEPTKGNRLVCLAHQMLLSSADLNFTGNIESKDIYKGVADVVVTDGFTGSAVLATMRGLSELILHSIQGHIVDSGNEGTNSGRLSTASRLRENIEFGASSTSELLGLQGHILLAHPSGHAAAISSAIHLAWRQYAISSPFSAVNSCRPD